MFRFILYITLQLALIINVSAQAANSVVNLKEILNENSEFFRNLPDTTKLLWFKEQCWKLRDLDKKRAYEYGLQALDIARDINSIKQEAGILNYLGVIQRNVGNNNEALEYFNEALAITRSYNIMLEQGYALNNIGNIYHLEGQYEQALSKIRQAVLIAKTLDDQLQLAYCYYQMGSTMLGLNNIDSAFYYYSKSLVLRENANVPHIHVSLQAIADLYHSQNNKKMEEKFLLKSLALSSEISIEQFGERQLYIRLGKLYFASNKLELAKKYFIDYLKKEEGKPSWSHQRLAAQYLTKIFKMENNPGVALKYSELSSALSDSIIEREARNEINKMTLKYKFGQEKEKMIAKQGKEEVNKKIIVHSLATGLFFIILFLAAVFRRHGIQKKINAELEKKNKLIISQKNQLKEANELQTRFISRASHEFRTPLTTIYSSAQLLERYGKKWGEDKNQEQINRIKEYVNDLVDILDDVLIINKVETKKMEFAPQHIDVKPLCDSLVKDIELLLSQKHSLEYNIGLKNEKYLLDKKLLKFIINNLLSNAVKYSPKGGRIIFSVFEKNKKLTLEITDEGIGIPEEERDNLFSSFYRCSNVGDIKGTGLGLSIVQKAVELHNGKMEFKSKLGQGTSFTISL